MYVRVRVRGVLGAGGVGGLYAQQWLPTAAMTVVG